MTLVERENGHRHANQVVEIARRGQRLAAHGPHHRRSQFLRGGFAGGASNRDRWQHGGDRVRAPMIADAGVIAALEEANRFAPLHNPPALATIRALSASVPGVPEIGRAHV